MSPTPSGIDAGGGSVPTFLRESDILPHGSERWLILAWPRSGGGEPTSRRRSLAPVVLDQDDSATSRQPLPSRSGCGFGAAPSVARLSYAWGTGARWYLTIS